MEDIRTMDMIRRAELESFRGIFADAAIDTAKEIGLTAANLVIKVRESAERGHASPDETVKSKADSLWEELRTLETKRVSASTAAIKASVAGDDAASSVAQKNFAQVSAEIAVVQTLIEQMETAPSTHEKKV